MMWDPTNNKNRDDPHAQKWTGELTGTASRANMTRAAASDFRFQISESSRCHDLCFLVLFFKTYTIWVCIF
jgi:hypothetical protein